MMQSLPDCVLLLRYVLPISSAAVLERLCFVTRWLPSIAEVLCLICALHHTAVRAVERVSAVQYTDGTVRLLHTVL
jgi:hypothetical protein